MLRQNPNDRVTSARLDAAIKMAELRFNTEYAECMRRAKDSAERRVGRRASRRCFGPATAPRAFPR